ncbi:MAG: metal-dependent hydrolase [Planctomycetia bacterium]|nr:metal-dependent hydrolase [Planctomycetia bacterium]
MAGFKTHLTVSSLAGVGYGATAHFMYGVPASTCILAGGLCGVSGMLPDVDSGPGRPLRESMGFAAAVVPMMLIDRLEQFGLSQEMMILVGALIYVAVRFGVAELLRRYTIHRGMFHSLPAAAIAGELAFLLASGDDVRLRVYKAGAVVLGYVSHLVLDELYSLELYRGRPRLKRSFGTALKVFSHSWWPNLSTYAKLALLTMIVIKEPSWMQDVQQHERQLRAERYAAELQQQPTAGAPRAGDAEASREANTVEETVKREVGRAASWFK